MFKKTEKEQIFLDNFRNQIKFHYLRGKGHILSYLKNRIQWYLNPYLDNIADFPPHVDIEISTHCNMTCPMCYRRTEEFQRRVKDQFMDKDTFAKIIEECARHKLFSIRLSLRGESFLHPDIFDFIELAKRSGIKEVSSLTNGLALTPEKFEKLVRLKFDWLIISFDGMGNTYESIRKPAKFNESFEKIKAYAQIKKQYGSRKPAVRIQVIWPAIKDNPEAFYRSFSPFADSVTANPLIDFLREDKNIEYDKNFICHSLYQRLVIGSDAKVLLCVCDDYGDYILGDVKKESIYSIWHGQRLNTARNWFKRRKINWWEYAPCKYCFYPRKKEKSWEVFIDRHKVDILRYTNKSDNSFVLFK